MLLLQHIIDNLVKGGRCGVVLDEGVVFRTNENAFVQTKRKLLDECDVYAIVSLPGGIFTAAGAGVKTNILFFTKGKRTEKIWYYDLSDIKVGKRTPFTIDKFDEFFELLPSRADSERSWTVDIDERKRIVKEQTAPLRVKFRDFGGKADSHKARIKELKKVKPQDKDLITKLEVELAEYNAEASKLNEQINNIENAVFDIKAVNPNRKVVQDTRTPAELISIIKEKQDEIMAALADLSEK